MTVWNTAMEDELVAVLKDWLKQQGRTQADLRRSLRASSTRMPALLEVLEREHRQGGLPKLAARLCAIEADWSQSPSNGTANRRVVQQATTWTPWPTGPVSQGNPRRFRH